MSGEKEEIEMFSANLKAAKIPNEPAQRKKQVNANLDYIPFGSDNLFPQVWEQQMRNSVVSRSILKDKVTYTVGDGLDFAGDTALENYALEVNSKGESLIDVIRPAYRDRYSGGNGYIEVVKNKGFLSFFHIDWTKCRIKKGGTEVIIHPDWTDYDNTKKLSVHIPLYPAFAKVKASQENEAEELPGERSIIHLKTYEPEFKFYGLPDAIAGRNAIAIGYSTTGWNKSRIENGMNLSGILLLSGKYSDEQAKKAKKKTEDTFTGEDNQGKMMVIVKDSGTDGRTENTEYVPIAVQSDGDWKNLSDEAKGEILMSFNWKRTLTNFDDTTGMNNSDKILNDYYIVLGTVITPEQDVVLEKVKQVITKHSKYNATKITHINKPPVPLFMIMKTPDGAFKKGEVRQSAGHEWDTEDDTQNEYMKDGSSNSSGNN